MAHCIWYVLKRIQYLRDLFVIIAYTSEDTKGIDTRLVCLIIAYTSDKFILIIA